MLPPLLKVGRAVVLTGTNLPIICYVQVSLDSCLSNSNIKLLTDVKVLLRGKAHAEWKITRAGERRCMKQDEQYLEERLLLWGKGKVNSNMYLEERLLPWGKGKVNSIMYLEERLLLWGKGRVNSVMYLEERLLLWGKGRVNST